MEFVYKLMGIKQDDRVKTAVSVQELLTKHGCSIKMRLGLHDVVGESCSKSGLIILELIGSEEEIDVLLGELNKIDGVTAKKMLI